MKLNVESKANRPNRDRGGVAPKPARLARSPTFTSTGTGSTSILELFLLPRRHTSAKVRIPHFELKTKYTL